MQKSPHHYATSTEITVSQLERFAQAWIDDGESRFLSPNTLDARRNLTEKLLWFLRQRERATCGTPELRQFLAYLARGHEEPGGRWGNPQLTKAAKPITARTYFVNLKTLFRFLVEEGVLPSSPVEALKPPIARDDQIQPFTDEQVQALLIAARKSRYPLRDEAILMFLCDTGCRATELCTLRHGDLDLTNRKCKVLGKGNKERSLPYGRRTARALYAYLKNEERRPDQPVFLAEGERRVPEGLTRSGLLQLLERLGQAAGVKGVRCSPHTCRHYFAVSFLRAGGNVFTLKELLGHTSLRMTNRYVALAQADIAAQHRLFSPGDRLGR